MVLSALKLLSEMTLPANDVPAWLIRIGANRDEEDVKRIEAAAYFAIQAHQGQKRSSGEDYVNHTFAVAAIVHELGLDSDAVIAALLHDIGHFIGEFGSFSMDDVEDRFHEESGAKLLQDLFPQLIVDCVRFHVPAKRYLCKVEPAYFNDLSEASVHSLKLQGGPMTDQEVSVFENNPHCDAIVKVRRYDDMSKIPEQVTPSFSHYAPFIQQVVDRHQADNPS